MDLVVLGDFLACCVLCGVGVIYDLVVYGGAALRVWGFRVAWLGCWGVLSLVGGWVLGCWVLWFAGGFWVRGVMDAGGLLVVNVVAVWFGHLGCGFGVLACGFGVF